MFIPAIESLSATYEAEARDVPGCRGDTHLLETKAAESYGEAKKAKAAKDAKEGSAQPQGAEKSTPHSDALEE